MLMFLEIAIDSVISFLQALKRPAHMRICAERSLQVDPGEKYDSPIKLGQCPHRQRGKTAPGLSLRLHGGRGSRFLQRRSVEQVLQGREVLLLHCSCARRLGHMILLLLLTPEVKQTSRLHQQNNNFEIQISPH